MAPGAVKTVCRNHLMGLLSLRVSVGGPASSERANQILLSFEHSVLCPPPILVYMVQPMLLLNNCVLY